MKAIEPPRDPNVYQKGNAVHDGDLAGRDVNKQVYNYNFAPSDRATEIDRLYEQLTTEATARQVEISILDELQHFKNQASDTEVIGLEKKLENARRLSLLRFAERTKEKFAKKLIRYEHSESAQRIYAILLAKAYSNFERHVYPKILDGTPEEVIDSAVSQYVVGPIEVALGTNQLSIFEDEIHGMIFFLTGNCHIKWN